MKTYNKKLTIIIPCFNEEKGIGSVIDAVPHSLLEKIGLETEIIVIDNNSTDKTVMEARNRNVRVIQEEHKGKGRAIVKGFKEMSPDTDYVVMLDGDDTYLSGEINRLIEPLMSGFCDVIIGSRLGGKINRNSLKIQNRIANWTYTFLVRLIYKANITDVLSGYFAWKKDVVLSLLPHLISDGFEIEMEMITKMVKLGYEIYSVPVTYKLRKGQSKLRSFKDGIKILYVFIKNFYWRPKREFSTKMVFLGKQ